LLLSVLRCGQHGSEPKQKSKRITTTRLRGARAPGVYQHRRVSDKVTIANGIRQQWDSAKCESLATCVETKHFASLT